MARTYGALVLAGGKARRMAGRNKALLQLEQRTFLSLLGEALEGFDEKLLSTNDPVLAHGTFFRPVPDRVPGRGPLEGLAAALTVCESDALVVVPCDVPLFSAELALALVKAAANCDALVCQDRKGGLHSLCGVYTKRCLPAADKMLADVDFSVHHLLNKVKSTVFPLAKTPFPDEVLTNVNTPSDLERLIKGKSPG